MDEPVLVAELRRRRLLALERAAQPPQTAEAAEAAEERRAEEATAARLCALGIRTPAPPRSEAAAAAAAGSQAAAEGVAAAAAASHAHPAPQPERAELPSEAPVAEPICRICHGGAELLLGRLFSPCRCRGTARFVHPACLAAWRTISEGRDSFFVCDVCGFRYNVRRAAWAGVLESRALLLGVTAAMLLAAIALVGLCCRAASLRIHLHFYRLVFWLPPWHNSSARALWRAFGLSRTLDTLVAGSVLCGLAGSVAAAHAAWREDPQHFYSRAIPSIAMSFASSGTPLLRMFVAGGLYYGYTDAARAASLCARQVLTRFGERVLDVDAGELAAAGERDLTE